LYLILHHIVKYGENTYVDKRLGDRGGTRTASSILRDRLG